MTGAAFPDPVAAGDAVVDLGGDGLEDGFDVRPGGGGTAGHDAGAVARALLAAGDAGADVKQALGLDVFHPAGGVLEQRIAAVDDEVAGFEVGKEMFDELVDGLASLDHEHHAARLLQAGDHLLDGVGADDVGALGFPGEKVVHLGDGPVEGHHGEAVVVHVQNQILAHHGQPDQCNVSLRFHLLYQLNQRIDDTTDRPVRQQFFMKNRVPCRAFLQCFVCKKCAMAWACPMPAFLRLPFFAKRTSGMGFT